MKQERLCLAAVLSTAVALLVPGSLLAQSGPQFTPNNLVLSRSVYTGTPSSVAVGQTLPPGCVAGTVQVPLLAGGTTNVTIAANSSSGCNTATNDGTYPTIFNNDKADGSFGITSPIYIDQLTPSGTLVNTLAVDPSTLVTSFSSKSELALNLSTDGNSVTFGGYVGGPGYTTGPNQLDVSNSNTPGVVDPTNPVSSQYYRSIAEMNSNGSIEITENNAYSGNNGRAAIKANPVGGPFYYQTGNGNNGGLSKTQLTTTQDGVNLVGSTGVELIVPGQTAPVPPNVAMIGNFAVTQVGYGTADKAGKDDNFRGLTIFNNTLYVTKGSGSNGINTVYQVGTAGTLPTPSNAPGGVLVNVPITIVPGFPTTLASGTALNGTTGNPVAYPFGLWFADATTLYVTDEGDGTLVTPPVNGNVADAASRATAGLQKWILNTTTNTWSMAYVLQNGLNIGVPYSVANGSSGQVYPTALNPATGGLRNITGRNNGDGTVTIWAVTSTLSTSGDQGADPNLLVSITDNLANTNPTSAASEQFTTVRAAGYGEVLRGISFTPGTPVTAVSNVTVASTGTPSTFGQLVSFTANVPASATGTVSFIIDNNWAANISATIQNGVATMYTSELAPGSHSVIAYYSGDTNWGPSNSAPFTQTVTGQGTPTVTLSSTASNSAYGQVVAVSAMVYPPSGTAATGTVTFNVDNGVFVIPATIVNNNATMFSSQLAPGAHSITAAYSGDSNWLPVTSSPFTQTVGQGTPSVTLSSSASSAAYGQLVTLTATLTNASGAAIPGTVTFNVDGGLFVIPATIQNNIATMYTSQLAPGPHTITASYSGTGNWGSASSAPFSQTVGQGTPSVTLSSSANPSTSGQVVAITATISDPSGTAATGTVTFNVDGGLFVIPATVQGNIATMYTSELSSGSHTITASYSGDSNWTAASATPYSQSVN